MFYFLDKGALPGTEEISGIEEEQNEHTVNEMVADCLDSIDSREMIKGHSQQGNAPYHVYIVQSFLYVAHQTYLQHPNPALFLLFWHSSTAGHPVVHFMA